jgi:hypothetical protein
MFVVYRVGVAGRMRRARFLHAAGGALFALALAPRTALAAGRRSSVALALTARNNGRRYAGDRALFTTVSPGVPGRDTALIAFTLSRSATVTLEAVHTARYTSTIPWKTRVRLGAGKHELSWTPDPSLPVGSYVMRLTIARGASKTVLGGKRPPSIARQQAPVVRVLGVEAAFLERSYAPGEPMELSILADATSLSLQFLHCGAETTGSERNDEMSGAPKGDPVPLDWTGKRSAPATITVQTGSWPTGVYAAQLTTDDGRVGFAPFILRPPTMGAARQLVVVPTNTWQAYNMYDRDGDGWGDTWYAGGEPPVVLNRPYRDRGVPPRFKPYDRAFLRWLLRTGKLPDMVAEDDLEAFLSGDDLRALYDLVVFSGHSEYMTAHTYDVVERFRDLGGRLIFLSADNFFWRVEKQGDVMRRIRPFRSEGRPEASFIGAQYRANDDGRRQGAYTVVAAEAAPWLFDKTGLATGSTFGETVGGYGIEIDAATADSPPGTVVLARVIDLFGPGLSGEMTYYETPAGARVFAAGTLDFGGSATFWPMTRMLENLWQHMLQDIPPPVPPPDPTAPPPPPPTA